MPNLDVTQTPAPAPVDTTNVVASLDTNTGPQASPAAFGPDLNGLAQGLDAANQDVQQTIYRDRYEQKEHQQAQGEAWALGQYSGLAKQWMQKSSDALAAGKPLDLAQINSDYQTQLDTTADSAPNDFARVAFLAKGTGLGLDIYRQSLDFNKNIQIRDNKANAQSAIDLYVDGARQGTVSPQDASAGVLSIGQAVAPAVPGIAAQVSAANTNIIHAGITNVAQTQGPGPAALAVRGGYGGAAIDPTHRELLATQLDNQQSIAGSTRLSLAQQNVNGLADKAAAGGFVSPVDSHAAATELANAQTATPTQTNPPDLVDFIQSRAQEYQGLADKLSGPYADIQLKGIQKIETQNINKVIEQRLNGMPLDQQQAQVSKLADSFGMDDPIVRQSMSLLDRNTHLLTPGDPQYAPAAAAMRNPTVASEMSTALSAMQGAANASDTGKAQGMMHTAVEDSFSAQRLMGVPAGQEQVLTPDQAKTFAAQAAVPGQGRNVYQQISQTYGDYAQQAMTEAFAKKGVLPGTIKLAGLNANSDEVWAAANFKAELQPKDKDDIISAISKNPTFLRYAAADSSNANNAPDLQDYANGLVTHAAYWKIHGGLANGPAVDMAVNTTIGHHFTFADSGAGHQMAIPTSISQSPAEIGDLVSKANTAAASLGPFRSDQNLIDPAMMQKMALSDGHWVYDKGNGSPQDARMALVFNTGPQTSIRATTQDGRPVSFSIAGLKSSTVIPSPMGFVGGTGEKFPLQTDATGKITDSRANNWDVSTYWGAPRLDTDPHALLPPLQNGPGVNAPAGTRPTPSPNGQNYLRTPSPAGPTTSSLDSKLPTSMKGLGPVFEKYGANVPGGPALLAAIAMHETGRGTSRAYLEGNNAMGVSNSAGPISFSSVEDSIAHQAHTLATSPLYSKFRQTGQIPDLGAQYAPVGAENDPRGLNADWTNGVSKFYQELNDGA